MAVPLRVGRKISQAHSGKPPCGFQFIGFPSEWGAEVIWKVASGLLGFQFIGFPSEWGVEVAGEAFRGGVLQVSNLLGFPASGESLMSNKLTKLAKRVSNLLGFPASGEG